MKSLVVNMILVLGLLLSIALTSAQANRSTFSAELFGIIGQENMKKNVIISPASIQIALAMTYMGAEGKTATELREGLYLGGNNVSKEQVAQQFGNLINKMPSSGKVTFKMANRIYVKNGLPIAPKFNDMAKRYFASGAENVDFAEKEKTIEKINNWIKEQTENKIQNLISSDDFVDDTRAVLVNAIYFEARWIRTFTSTTKKEFHLSKSSTKEIDMMSIVNDFGYAELTDLDAKALTLGYIDTNIQMLVLLPNQLDGLAHLERQLIEIDLTKYSNKFLVRYGSVSLPKFKIEFDISLEPTLRTLGIRELFMENVANLSSLFTTVKDTYVSKVLHKAFIEVNETGTEAAAVTGSNSIGPTVNQMPMPGYEFNADHPFYFAIFDEDTVYFSGHFVGI